MSFLASDLIDAIVFIVEVLIFWANKKELYGVQSIKALSTMFCPSCGADTPKAGLCIDCYLNRNSFSLKKSEFELCECGKYYLADKWIEDWDLVILKFVERNLVTPKEITVSSIDVAGKRTKEGVDLEVDFIGLYQGIQIPKTLQFKLKTKERPCRNCKHLGGGYFEAVIQIRDDKRPTYEPEEEFISQFLRVRGGWDYYLTSQPYAEKFTNLLHKWGFLVKKTTKIYGKKDGKDVFRFSYSVKRPDFKEGDVLGFKDNPYVVLNVKNNVQLRSLQNGQDKYAPLPRLINTPILARKDEGFKAVVTEVKPKETIIMGLGGYENHKLSNPRKTLKTGDEVEIIKIGKKYYSL
ncbi:MAG: NMD3-related protein [Candidatus Altiarchaeota archaeon]